MLRRPRADGGPVPLLLVHVRLRLLLHRFVAPSACLGRVVIPVERAVNVPARSDHDTTSGGFTFMDLAVRNWLKGFLPQLAGSLKPASAVGRTTRPGSGCGRRSARR